MQLISNRHEGISQSNIQKNRLRQGICTLSLATIFLAICASGFPILSKATVVPLAALDDSSPTSAPNPALLSQFADRTVPPISLSDRNEHDPERSGSAPLAMADFADPYEPDDRCEDASTIQVNGEPQIHDIGFYLDEDWIKFEVVANITYVIAVTDVGSDMNAGLFLYESCGQKLSVSTNADGSGATIIWTPGRNGIYYLRIRNGFPEQFGVDTQYQLGIRTTGQGAVIIVGGRLRVNDPLESQIRYLTEHAYQVFNLAGYGHDSIYYLSPDTDSNVDAVSSSSSLSYAIRNWALEKVTNGAPLFLYFGDHGDTEMISLNIDDWLTSNQLNTLLNDFQQNRPNSEIIVIIEAAYAGSFITAPVSISSAGRIIITSASDYGVAYASGPGGGAIFSDPFFDALGEGINLWNSFQLAAQAIEQGGWQQTPWLDGDGDGVPFPIDTDDQGVGEHIRLVANTTPIATQTSTATFTQTPTHTPTSTSTPASTHTPTKTPSPTRTQTPSITPTRTSTHTATPTRTPSPSHTPSPTASPTPARTPTPTPRPDGYEPDDFCTSANALPSNGPVQQHSFHAPGDIDWVRFNALAGVRYVITARHLGPLADVEFALHDACQNPPVHQTQSLGTDATLIWDAPTNGLYFLRLTNNPPEVFGSNTTYEIGIRSVSTGAAIIVGGRLKNPEALQAQINDMSLRAYRTFRNGGYDDDDIYYLSADATLPDITAPSSVGTLRYALTTWAAAHVQDGEPLFVYLADHGEKDLFFLDTGNQIVTPGLLDDWLRQFQNQRLSSPVVIIIEACFSGSFITPTGSISAPGRIIITSTSDNLLANAKTAGFGGADFSDAFFENLAQNYDVWNSYLLASETVKRMNGDNQTPWLDANANGKPYPLDRSDEGAGRNLGLGQGTTGLGSEVPFIEPPVLPAPDGATPGQFEIKVLDENRSSLHVWMEVTTPITPPPSAPPGYITPISHAQRVDLTYNPTTDRFEADFTFGYRGSYQFVFQAEDAGGQRAQPVVVEVQNGGYLYLPLLIQAGAPNSSHVFGSFRYER